MPTLTLCRLLLLLLLSGSATAADWSRMKFGLTAVETAACLGEPLMRTSGQGFEVWIYDAQAEVIFYGAVVGWTSPRTAQGRGQSYDVWQEAQTGPSTDAQILPRPPAITTNATPRRVTATQAKLAIFR